MMTVSSNRGAAICRSSVQNQGRNGGSEHTSFAAGQLGRPCRKVQATIVAHLRGSNVMKAKLSYAIKFVANMDEAVRFHRDILGLPLKFQSPEWSEFATESVTLALHTASEKNPAGKVELGYVTKDLKEVYANREAIG